jgi:phosphohistidine phosphatase
MEIFLIRHAQAVDGEAMRDEDRPLTGLGRRQALDVGGALAKEKVKLGLIVTSPLVRAVETASLVAVATGYDGGLGVTLALRPDGGWKHLWKEIIEPARADGGQQPLALVGHEPSIGHFLSRFLGQKGLSMSKGAVARLLLASSAGHDQDGQASVDHTPPAKLLWTLSPKRLAPGPSLT